MSGPCRRVQTTTGGPSGDYRDGRRGMVAPRLRRTAALDRRGDAGDGGTVAGYWAAGSGAAGHVASGRVGFRAVRVELTEGRRARSTSFGFVVNRPSGVGQGSDWIPDDAFPHRVDRQRCRSPDWAQAEEAGINLLRVWGGGIFEAGGGSSPSATSGGLMVWQDFLFACAAVRRGAAAVGRGRGGGQGERHPAYDPPRALCCGSAGRQGKPGGVRRLGAGPSRLDGKTWGLGCCQDLLPSIVAEARPRSRVGGPGSPWSPGTDRGHPNDAAHGAHAHLGCVEPASTTWSTAGLPAEVRGGVRLAGAARVVHPAPRAVRRSAHPHQPQASSSTRRR